MMLLPRSEGPPIAWPAPLDAALDRWASASGRVRTVLRMVLLALVVLAASGGLVRGPWGPPVEVLVARVDVPAGAPVTMASVEVLTRPATLVPADALREMMAVPHGAISAGAVPAGAVLTARHLVVGGPAGAAEPGTAVVPVPADLMPALPLGTRVDVAVGDDLGAGQLAATGAVVLADDGAFRWLQIDRAAVPLLATGISRGSLVIAVLPHQPDAAP